MNIEKLLKPASASAVGASVAAVFVVLGLTGGAVTQTLPDTQWVYVTFYDFH